MFNDMAVSSVHAVFQFFVILLILVLTEVVLAVTVHVYQEEVSASPVSKPKMFETNLVMAPVLFLITLDPYLYPGLHL